MRTSLRKLVLGTASALALGISGTASGYAADTGDTANAASMALPSRISENSPTADFLRKDDIRWAQVELRNRGLYKGSLDGVLGPETKSALGRFQQINGLGRTASLDAHTWEALTGNPATGSSAPSDSDRLGSTTNSSPASNLGR